MKRERRSVLFVMTTMGRAGAERALLNLLETFPEEEFEICLFALFPHGELFEELPRGVTVLNRKVSGVSPLS